MDWIWLSIYSKRALYLCGYYIWSKDDYVLFLFEWKSTFKYITCRKLCTQFSLFVSKIALSSVPYCVVTKHGVKVVWIIQGLNGKLVLLHQSIKYDFTVFNTPPLYYICLINMRFIAQQSYCPLNPIQNHLSNVNWTWILNMFFYLPTK